MEDGDLRGSVVTLFYFNEKISFYILFMLFDFIFVLALDAGAVVLIEKSSFSFASSSSCQGFLCCARCILFCVLLAQRFSSVALDSPPRLLAFCLGVHPTATLFFCS
jgi:hypothetical protein